MLTRYPALGCEEKRRPELRARRAELQCAPYPGAIDDPARGDHRHRDVDRRKQIRERHEPVLDRAEERPAMAAGLRALRHDSIDTGALEERRFLRSRRGAGDRDAALLQRPRVDEPKREA